MTTRKRAQLVVRYDALAHALGLPTEGWIVSTSDDPGRRSLTVQIADVGPETRDGIESWTLATMEAEK